MPLKSLIINGFKSFADKTTITFTQGITGIVGPNGSGKSNITEAIRWVMGEQSAKSLRGSHMPDVIFAGSAVREPLNRAEVTLVFDNTQHDLPAENATVSVTRRLFRDGTSEFYLNQKACRLRDITDLFLDSGLGKASFSIISQGRVEEIFNSKPEERRTIIEEVAGVYKYKQQKKQAEAELAVTEENLNRVADIHDELASRVEPLRRQASLARDYQQQKAAFDRLDQQILALELHDLELQKQEREQRQQELATISSKIDSEATASSAQLQKLRQANTTLNATIEQKQALLLEQTRQAEALNGKISLSTERSSYHHSSLTALTKELAEVETRQQQQTDNLTITAQNLQAAQAQKEKLDRQLAQLVAQENENQEDIAARLNELRSDYIELLQQQTTLRNELVYQQEQLTQKRQQQETLGTEQTSQQDRLTQQEKTVKTLADQVTDATTELATAEAQVQEQQHRYQQYGQKIETQQQAWYDRLAKFQQLKARYQSLKESTDDHSGFYLGVRAVLNPQNHLRGLRGAVADLLTVPAKFQMAIEQVLGAQLQQIVCQDAASASQAIAFLKEKRLGRATFLPLTTIQPREVRPDLLATVVRMPGYLGVGAEIVTMLPELRRVQQHLLGNVLIVDELAHATAIAKAIRYQTRIVTLEGDILTPGGAMTGGRIKQQGQGLLNRQQSLTEQQGQLKQLQQELNAQQATIQQLKDQRQTISGALTDQEISVKKLQERLVEAKSQQQQQTAQLERLQREHQVVTLDQQRLVTDLQTLATAVQTKQQQQDRLNQQVDQAKVTIEQQQERLANFTSQKENLTQQINEVKTQQAVAALSLRNQEELQERQDQALTSSTQRGAELQRQLAALNENASQTAVDLDQVKQSLANLQIVITTAQKDLASLKQQRTAQEQQVQDLEPETQRFYQLQKETAKEQETVAVKLNSLKTAMALRLTTLREDYQLSYEAAYQTVVEQQSDLAALRSEFKLVKLALADIGQVNLEAIDEYATVNERYQFLTKQQDDLIAARKQLLETMAEMDQEVSQRFAKTFTAVDAAFQHVFPQMFGGGQAHLVLTDPTDLLNTGIEINAQPPGKKLQHLSLLSGGERALTAITLLFAILKVRPAPFSILDEVEASLDEANVVRFANYLQNYEQRTQFIVITHRKGTMMKVDRLYGVTMQESGVSKIISVSLTDVAQ
ncbi:chromosome segregation protein SMC [Lapidilactobacillus luobeiensis]|uniref:chromosome segregation protein SMC n=1 Tax=Lapidilactobacillus luobeiensis TaxID=2950371 RepID=UPI0021C3B327|nr:chromosome segregation protein SMC [Lapidilactobacillus luobeiensis]